MFLGRANLKIFLEFVFFEIHLKESWEPTGLIVDTVKGILF